MSTQINQIPAFKNINKDSLPAKQSGQVVPNNTGKNNSERIHTSDQAAITSPGKGEKVGFKEGMKLVGGGFWNKTKEVVKTIVKHPIQTVGVIAFTTAALTALPLIRITASAGAAGLALLFAGYAVGKTAYHSYNAIKHGRSGEHNKVRKDLKKIGGDGLDLVLSLPFAPKALNAVERQAKYTRNGLKPMFNRRLWRTLKKTTGLWNKVIEFTKADLRIAYRQHTRELGIKTFPTLKFKKMEGKGGTFSPLAGEITINTDSKIGIINIFPFRRNFFDGVLRHELKHFEQYKTIARTEGYGIEAIQQAGANRSRPENIQAQINRVEAAIEKYNNPTPFKNPVKRILRPIVRFLYGKTHMKKMQEELAYLKKVKSKLSKDHSDVPIQEDLIKIILEACGEVPNKRLKSTKSTINSQFYRKVINREGKIASGTPEAEQAARYFEASSNYTGLNKHIYINHKAYKNNLLEKEAFAVQRQFNKRRPGLKAVSRQELAMIADEQG